MYCNFRPNCGCCCCGNYYPTTSVTLANNMLMLNIEELATLNNNQPFCVRVAQPLPNGAGNDTVVAIQSGTGTAYTTITPCANNVYADQIKQGGLYCFKFATDTKCYIYKGGTRLCRTSHTFEPVTNVAPSNQN